MGDVCALVQCVDCCPLGIARACDTSDLGDAEMEPERPVMLWGDW
jgi:hypothetical protein